MKENMAKCPFYMNDSQSKIYCQGAVGGCKSTTLFFDSPKSKAEHFKDFCADYCWVGCPLAQILCNDKN